MKFNKKTIFVIFIQNIKILNLLPSAIFSKANLTFVLLNAEVSINPKWFYYAIFLPSSLATALESSKSHFVPTSIITIFPLSFFIFSIHLFKFSKLF